MRKLLSRQNARTAERGNAFLFILVGVALFAALSYTVARGFQSGTTHTISERQITLIASDLMQYAQKVERAVNRVRRRDHSEVDISFADYSASYNNANCAVDTCRVFYPGGGDISVSTLPEGATWVDTGWEFHNGHEIEGVGNTCGDETCTELMMTVHFTSEALCEHINEELGVGLVSGSVPSVSDITSSLHTGTFAYVNTVGDIPASATIEGKTSACVAETTGCDGAVGSSCYAFYHVLLAR